MKALLLYPNWNAPKKVSDLEKNKNKNKNVLIEKCLPCVCYMKITWCRTMNIFGVKMERRPFNCICIKEYKKKKEHKENSKSSLPVCMGIEEGRKR